MSTNQYTLPETNSNNPENQWLEDEFPFGMAYVQGQTCCQFQGVYVSMKNEGREPEMGKPSGPKVLRLFVGGLGPNPNLGGGNSNIFGIFTPKIGEDEPNPF